jgi:hypothetical protein
MKKIIFILVVLAFGACASATVKIIVEGQNGIAAIKYATDGEKVRAFALDVKLSAGTVTGISDYIKGESTITEPNHLGYGIFPARFSQYISVDAGTGEVTSWDVNDYNPLADPCDPGSLGGLGTGGVTLEMGSLYYPPADSSPNAPPNAGLLCKLAISQSAKVTVTANAVRGGIVLTDISQQADVVWTQATDIQINK